MKKLFIATRNPHKLAEIRAIFNMPQLELVGTDDVPGLPEVEEDGETLSANATKKAAKMAAATGMWAMADDSGLEVDALGGAPGVRSARYAGNSASDTDNVARLLKELTDLPPAQRSARFQCVMAWLRHPDDPAPVICQGTWEGHIALAARGSNGFGYDPVFVVPGEGRTAAELEAGVKNRLSHRGLALRQMVACLHSHQ